MKNKILYLIPVLLWIIGYFVFSFDGLYGQDAYEYLRYSEALKTYFISGNDPGDYFWGVYYPVLGCILSFVVSNMALALQLISLISLLICTYYIEKIIYLINKEEPIQYIPFLFFTLSPIVLIHSFLVMSDILACCFITIAFYYLLKYIETKKNNTIIVGFLFCTIAIMTRYASAVILFPISCLVLKYLIQNKNYKVFLLSILMVLLVISPHILIRTHNSLEFLSNEWLKNWNILNLLESSFYTIDGEVHNKTINLIYIFFPIFHPIFSFLGGILIFIFLKYRSITSFRYDKLIIISVIFFALFLGGIPCQAKRFMLLSFPLLIVVFYPTIRKFLNSFAQDKLVFFIIIFIQLTLSFYFVLPFYNRNKLEITIYNEMKKYEHSTIYIFDMDLALKGRKLHFDYKNLYFEKFNSFEKEALVLINEKQLEKQWKGKNPLINWENIKKKCVLVKLKSLDKNWDLYKISTVNNDLD